MEYGLITLSRVFEFSASHRLFRPEWDEEKNRQVYGECAHPHGHGHNYRLEVAVTGVPDPLTGMIINAALLDEVVTNEVIRDVDQRNLNYIEWIVGVPTTEVVVNAIWERLEPAIARAHSGVTLQEITVWETRRICVKRTRSPKD